MTIKEIVEQSRASIVAGDLLIVLQLLSFISPKNIIEIGAWHGYSAYNWSKAFNPTSLITLEKEKGLLDPSLRFHEILSNQYWEESDSHDPEVLRTMRIYIPTADFLFIDGDHSYEGVKKDWEMYSPLVRKGGIVALHDVCYTSNDPLSPVQVERFWNELKKTYNYVEIKSSPSSTGMGLIYL